MAGAHTGEGKKKESGHEVSELNLKEGAGLRHGSHLSIGTRQVDDCRYHLTILQRLHGSRLQNLYERCPGLMDGCIARDGCLEMHQHLLQTPIRSKRVVACLTLADVRLYSLLKWRFCFVKRYSN
jgi:hypothetical protein